MTIQTYPAPKSQVTSSFWRYTATGGETTLTGIDNAGVSLAYLPGQEQVYLNGVMLMRGTDYTATNGTSITGLASLTAADYVQITTYSNFTVTNIPVGSISGAITNLQLANSTFTIGSTLFNLGDTKTTIAGLTLTSPTINNPIVGTQYSTSVPLTVKGSAGQAVSLQEWQNSSSSVLIKIDQSGNLAIGTTSPDEKLTIQESGDAQISLKNSSGTTKAYIGTNGAFGSAATDDLRIRSDASNIIFGFSGFEKARLTSSGNFGIGNTGPTFGLDVNKYIGSVSYGTAYQGIRLVTGYARSDTTEYIGRGVAFGVQNYTATLQGTDGSLNNYDLSINPTNGNIYLGTINSIGSRVHVSTTQTFSPGATWSTWAFTLGTTTTSSGTGSGALGFGYDDTLGATIASVSPGIAWKPIRMIGSTFNWGSNGNTAYNNMILDGNSLLIGYTTNQNTAYKLQVNSQIFATSASIATSDGKFKENVNTINNGLQLVNALNPVSFNWKKHDKHNFVEGKTVGFIAQEVREALKDYEWVNNVIKENKDEKTGEEFLGLVDSAIIPLLVSAVKELSAKVKALEAK